METFFIINILALIFSNAVFGEINNTDSDRLETKWISQLFSEAEKNFDMISTVSSDCKRDYESYKLHLRNQTTWAVRMLESSEWPSLGLLSGTTNHLGNWDECLLVSSRYIKGQYCLVRGVYDYSGAIPSDPANMSTVEWPSEELSVWNVLKMFEANPVRVNRTNLHWALCIPASCSRNDLIRSLSETVYPIFENNRLNITIDVEPAFCQIKQAQEYSQGYYIAKSIFILILLVVLLSSVNDLMNKKSEDSKDKFWMEIFRSFSAVNNSKKLYYRSPASDYGIIHVYKFLGLILIIYGHRRVFFLGFPNSNTEAAELDFKKIMNLSELTHLTIVDVFFMLTGFLTYHLDYKKSKKYGGVYCIISIIHRWFRLIPVFGILILFLIYIFPYVSDGPLWNSRVSEEINYCKTSWWANLLVINNIVETDNQCLLVSWYMSVDMHLTVIGFTLMYFLSKNEKFGLLLTLITFFCGIATTFAMAYINGYHAILPLYISAIRDMNKVPDFTRFYVATYTRIGPYLIGFMTAILVKSLQEKKFVFSTKQKLFGMLLWVFGDGYQYLGFNLFDFHYVYDPIKNAAYAATYRLLYVSPWAFVLCLYFTSGLGSLSKVFDIDVFPPIGRLTYSVFLVNTVLQLYYSASQRSLLSSSILLNRIYLTASDVTFSYMIGNILFIFLEAPIANISKLMRDKILRKVEESTRGLSADKGKYLGQEYKFSQKKSEVMKDKYVNNGYNNETSDTAGIITKI